LPQTIAFPQDLAFEAELALELVDEASIREHLQRSLPVDCLLDWLRTHYGQLADTTMLRLFHDLQHEPDWQCEPTQSTKTTDLQAIRVLHYSHRINTLP
jgi:hypothetical protein